MSDQTDAQLARSVALAAAEVLRDLCVTGACPDAELGDRGDKDANALILRLLHAARPDDYVLSEEAADDGLRCAARRVWVVDPLDGTREFVKRNRSCEFGSEEDQAAVERDRPSPRAAACG